MLLLNQQAKWAADDLEDGVHVVSYTYSSCRQRHMQ